MQVYREVTDVKHEELFHGNPLVETNVVVCGPEGHTTCEVPPIMYVHTQVSTVCVPSWQAPRILQAIEDAGIQTDIREAHIIDLARGPRESDIIRHAIKQHDAVVAAVRQAVNAALSRVKK